MIDFEYRILYVCMGNICRSLTAEAVFYKKLVDRKLMDWDNRALLEERCPAQHLHKVRGLAEFLQTSKAPLTPDPYCGGYQGFEQVLDLIEEASESLMKLLLQKAQA